MNIKDSGGCSSEKMPDKNDPKYKDRYERRCPPDESSPKRHVSTRLPPRYRDSPTHGYFSGHRLRFRYRRVHLEHLSHYDGIPQQPADTHGDGNAGFGAAGKTQEAARGEIRENRTRTRNMNRNKGVLMNTRFEKSVRRRTNGTPRRRC